MDLIGNRGRAHKIAACGVECITSLSQLAGQTVTRPQGSYSDRYLQGVLANDGLTGKVHLTAMLLPEGIPAVDSPHLGEGSLHVLNRRLEGRRDVVGRAPGLLA